MIASMGLERQGFRTLSLSHLTFRSIRTFIRCIEVSLFSLMHFGSPLHYYQSNVHCVPGIKSLNIIQVFALLRSILDQFAKRDLTKKMFLIILIIWKVFLRLWHFIVCSRKQTTSKQHIMLLQFQINFARLQKIEPNQNIQGVESYERKSPIDSSRLGNDEDFQMTMMCIILVLILHRNICITGIEF